MFPILGTYLGIFQTHLEKALQILPCLRHFVASAYSLVVHDVAMVVGEGSDSDSDGSVVVVLVLVSLAPQ